MAVESGALGVGILSDGLVVACAVALADTDAVGTTVGLSSTAVAVADAVAVTDAVAAAAVEVAVAVAVGSGVMVGDGAGLGPSAVDVTTALEALDSNAAGSTWGLAVASLATAKSVADVEISSTGSLASSTTGVGDGEASSRLKTKDLWMIYRDVVALSIANATMPIRIIRTKRFMLLAPNAIT